jgi:hypothetical protein
MRLNAVPPSSITRPEVSAEVGGVAATHAIGSRGAGATVVVTERPAEQSAPAQTPAPPVDRRGNERRGDERRKQKLPILLEMRVGPRRTGRRRAGDEAAPSIDTKA